VAGSELRYGSLFSGIGGIDLGLDLAGFECAWQVEIDDYCREVLEAHWPNTKRYSDIYKVKGTEVEPVDILCGGFPCQPVSLAGKRGGVDDERWLWDEFYRLICELRPRWVVAENVPGLLSANSGRAFAGVLRDLAKSGYDVVWDLFPAGGPGGVGAPHKRTRVFIVAKLADTKGKRHGRRTGKKRRITKRELQQEKQGRSKVGREVKGRSESHRRKNTKVADTDSSGQQSVRKGEPVQEDRKGVKHRSGDARDVADSKRFRSQRPRKSVKSVNSKKKRNRKTVEFVNGSFQNQWAVEPNVGRVADGISNRVDRLKALGNAVVPQVAYKVARMIYEYTEKEKRS
jgi:DNA (cytosine-5)-methyltransferase 1